MKHGTTKKRVLKYFKQNPNATIRDADRDLGIKTAGQHVADLRYKKKLPTSPNLKAAGKKYKKVTVNKEARKVRKLKVDNPNLYTLTNAMQSQDHTLFMSCEGKKAVDMAEKPAPAHPIDIPTKLPEKKKLPFLCRMGIHDWECYDLTWSRVGQGRMCTKCNLQEERYRRPGVSNDKTI